MRLSLGFPLEASTGRALAIDVFLIRLEDGNVPLIMFAHAQPVFHHFGWFQSVPEHAFVAYLAHRRVCHDHEHVGCQRHGFRCDLELAPRIWARAMRLQPTVLMVYGFLHRHSFPIQLVLVRILLW